MKSITFRVVTTISIAVTITIAALSIIGTAITGFYPGIVVFLAAALVPITSCFYERKIISRSDALRKSYYTTFTIINLLIILIFVFMTFVILVDRVFPVVLQ